MGVILHMSWTLVTDPPKGCRIMFEETVIQESDLHFFERAAQGCCGFEIVARAGKWFQRFGSDESGRYLLTGEVAIRVFPGRIGLSELIERVKMLRAISA